MSDKDNNKIILKGGEFIIKDANDIFVPEEANEEQEMVKQMVVDFKDNVIYPVYDRLEKQEDGLAIDLMKQAGELGLLGTHMPEELGGMQLDTNSNTMISEIFGAMGSFAVSYSAHIGIGMLPILYYGTQAQKEKYLPDLIAGTNAASYCLTEPGSGSDALAAKTSAVLSEDGKSYIINGQKMWITNAGFANIFIVFAQLDGDKFTCFIVERDLEGVTFGAEEDKLGIKGSSTRQVFFENVKIPTENLLGEIGRGHLIAFNVLNIGRFKLGLLGLGGSKANAISAIKYANERHQFGKPIASFGAIKYKLAEQAIRNFATESATYRVSDLMGRSKDQLIKDGETYSDAVRISAEEYAVECSIIKVAGSEALDYVVDETVQIHGGLGFSEEMGAARAYRDARINRIFEGTNEINRLLMVDMLLKRAMKGKIDIVGPAWEVQKELSSMPSFETLEGDYANEAKAVKDFKKIILMVAGGAAKMQMEGQLNLKEEQELLMNVADIMIDVYLAESILLRVQKLENMDTVVGHDVYMAIMKTFIHDANSRVLKNATDAIASFTEGDLMRTFLMGLKRYTKYPVQNVKNLRRTIAAELIEADDLRF